jgi:hypothetical protein
LLNGDGIDPQAAIRVCLVAAELWLVELLGPAFFVRNDMPPEVLDEENSN